MISLTLERVEGNGGQNGLKRPIAEAATGVSYFERSAVHRTNAQIQLGEVLLEHSRGASFEAMAVSATVRSYTIARAVLDADTGLLLQDGATIPETSYFSPEAERRTHSNAVQIFASEDLITGFNRVHDRHQHWITQCVPAIDWALRQKRANGARLLLPPLAQWQEDILRILGYADVPRITVRPGTVYHLPKVEYSEFLNGTTAFRVCLSARDTARRILDRLPRVATPHRLLYVPFPAPYYGSIANESEVVESLRRRGAFVVDPKLPPAERINLFREADVVIGPVGGGLTDVLFCRPGTLLWEWMPEHYQNASFNRLAQAAEVDYWGDMFKSTSDQIGRWRVDMDLLDRRLREIPDRQRARTTTATRATNTTPLDEVLLAFESLGDNCEFGLVQRQGAVEPLGLFRFAGMSLAKMVGALQARLEGIGTIETIDVSPAGETRELMVHEKWLDTRYHTFIREGQIGPEELRQSEAKRLAFLRRKMLDDMATGEKIWVWREWGQTDPERLRPLLEVLRSLGPNTLFWVVTADADHPAGTVEWLDQDFIKGYVERLAPYHNAGDINYPSWFEACQAAFDLCRQRGKGKILAKLSPDADV